MRRFLIAAGCLALVHPALPATGQAQEEEQGQLGYVMDVEVAPAHRAAYREALQTLVQAAGDAGLEYEWHFWSNDTGYHLYYPVENMAYFDDGNQFWAAFEGTPGEAGRDAFFGAMQQIPTHAKTSIVRSIPDVMHWPEGYTNDDWNVGHFHFEWLNAGQDEAWTALAKDFVAFLGKIGYPFGVQAHRTEIGDDRMVWVFFVPSLADYHSDATWDDLIEAADAQADWDAISDRFGGVVGRWTHSDASYVSSMSYVPEM
jgi:hypothetical protein